MQGNGVFTKTRQDFDLTQGRGVRWEPGTECICVCLYAYVLVGAGSTKIKHENERERSH